jgi:hypothetical protein
MDVNKTAMMALVVSLLGAACMYEYTVTGLQFSDVFDYGAWLGMLGASTVMSIVAAGALMALSVVATLYFTATLERRDAITGSIFSGIVIIFASLIISGMSAIAFLMSFFYAASLVLIAALTNVKPKGAIDKIKAGWSAGMKLTYILAIGAMVAGLYFTSANLAEYQSVTKASIADFTKTSVNEMNLTSMMSGMDLSSLSGIDMTSVLTAEEMAEIVNESISDADIENMIIASIGEAGYESLSEGEKSALMADTRDSYVEQATANYDPELMQATMSSVTQKISQQVQQKVLESDQFQAAQAQLTDDMIEQTIDSMPFMSTMLDLLPLFTGFMLLTAAILFGQVIISPVAAAASLAVPSSKEE